MKHAIRLPAVALFAVFVSSLPAPSAGAVAGANASAPAAVRLPDLDQEVPDELEITRAGPPGRRVERLGFRSAVRNIGSGPLVIAASRPSRATPAMRADQLIAHAGGGSSRVRGVGRLRFIVSPDHRHWHLLDFDRYELRRAGERRVLVRDRKSGFCLGDRYPATARRLPGAVRHPLYTSRCGLNEPQLLHIREGISVGWGDDYAPTLEGQYLPLTGLRAGRYVLVHRVNADRRLRESDYGNDAASLLLELRRPHGGRVGAQVKVLRRCPATALCDARERAAGTRPAAP